MPAGGPAKALRAFGARPDRIRLLQRRQNAHWLVAAGADRFVLRRFGTMLGHYSDGSVAWELEQVERIAALGWPAPRPLAPLLELDGAVWALLPFLGGRHLGHGNVSEAEYRLMGGLLADLHTDLARLPVPPQRPGRTSNIDGALPETGGPGWRAQLIADLARVDADLGRQFAAAVEALDARDLPAAFASEPRIIVHGDFSPWNLRLRGGRISALLDFELAHVDVAAADLAFARRGYHDPVVEGYVARRPLPDWQLALLDALWLGSLFSGAWKMLEAARQSGAAPDAAHFAWHGEQLRKTWPYGRG